MKLSTLLSRYAPAYTVACKGIILVSAFLVSSATLALESDRNQPADIEADDTTIDFKTGQRTFVGNVIVVQGTLRIKADKVVANYKDGQLVNATAWGRLARFKSRPDGKPDDVEGLAKKIFVNQQSNTLTLTSNATLKQGTNTANGAQIVYNMANDTMKIKGSRIGSGGSTDKARPNRKLKDPFADDPIPAVAKDKPKTTTTDSVSPKEAQEKSQETVEPRIETTSTKSGRSRLIIKPKKKGDEK